MRKKIIAVITGVAVLVLGVVLYFSYQVMSLNTYMDKVQITNVNLAEVADGTYTGEADAGVVRAKVEVAVTDHGITAIRILEHDNGQGKAAEAIVDRMISEQRIDVDAVAGATYSSRVIADAVQKALR